MTDLRKAAEMALEALVNFGQGNSEPAKALCQALAQPEQEPVVWITPAGEGFRLRFERPTNDVPLGWEPLYTTPPKREWFGLNHFEGLSGLVTEEFYAGAVWAEKKLKEMNGG